MSNITATRRGFLAMSTVLAGILVGCGQSTSSTAASDSKNESDASKTTVSRQTISNDEDGAHAIEASGETKSYTAVDVKKTGNADGDEADFYGKNAAVFATEKATLDLDDVTVDTNGTHANAIFSYGEGTTVNVSNSTIETSGNCSGGIMVTGGGTLNATDLSIHTTGNSSASIRSDRGGGVQNVTGGTYATEGVGSPAIYSTAEVHVKKAKLSSTASQGIVVEGKNSVELVDCEISAHNCKKNSDKSEWYQAVMIYQSMSGDAAQGEASFSMEGGKLSNVNGDILFVNNTVASIQLKNAKLENNDAGGCLLRAAAAGWGSEGNNGGHVTLRATHQMLSGDVIIDDVSSLNLYLEDGSTFSGCINRDEAMGEEYVEIADGCTWELTADSHITSLTCGQTGIMLNGHVLFVGSDQYVEGTSSTGSPVVVETTGGSNGPSGGNPPSKPGGEGGDGGEPPAKPEGEAGGDAGGEPPAKPSGDTSAEPPTQPAA